LHRNDWSVWNGTGGQFAPESVVRLNRNTHSHFIIERNIDIKDKNAFVDGVLSEAHELSLRIAAVAYTIADRYGLFSHHFIKSLHKTMESDVNNLHFSKEVIEAIGKRLEFTEDQIEIFNKSKQASAEVDEKGWSIHSFSHPFLTANMPLMSKLGKASQGKLFKFRAKIEQANEEIELSRFYFKATFDDNMSDSNKSIIKKNYKNNQVHLFNLLVGALDAIEEVVLDLAG